MRPRGSWVCGSSHKDARRRRLLYVLLKCSACSFAPGPTRGTEVLVGVLSERLCRIVAELTGQNRPRGWITSYPLVVELILIRTNLDVLFACTRDGCTVHLRVFWRVPASVWERPRETTTIIAIRWWRREKELAEVRRLLERSRLLTLTGPGGCGKTRLALVAAGDLVGGFEDGAWLVELAALADPAL